MENAIKRGEIWWADFGSRQGSEQGGVRPIVVVQNDIGNKHAPTIIGAPVTTQKKRSLPTHVNLNKDDGGLPYDSTVLLEQVVTLDKSRLRGKIGYINMQRIDCALLVSLGLGWATNSATQSVSI